MIVVMQSNAEETSISAVQEKIRELGYSSDISYGIERVVIGLIGADRRIDVIGILQAMEGVERVIPILKPIKLASREHKPKDTIITLGDMVLGGDKVVVMAGPCAVERRDQVLLTALTIKEAGAKVLRGGAFKTPEFPNDFPGLGKKGLEILMEAKQETDILTVTEVRSPEDVAVVEKYVDILQIGARYMQNYDLLASAANTGKPILLRRGIMSSIEELLMSAEYILRQGNPQVILCERGIRTFESQTPFTLDLCAVPILKRISHLPVIVDPSHGTGDVRYVSSMAKAAIAAGADGLQIEVHPNPHTALSHGMQALELQHFKDLMEDLCRVAKAVDKTI